MENVKIRVPQPDEAMKADGICDSLTRVQHLHLQ